MKTLKEFNQWLLKETEPDLSPFEYIDQDDLKRFFNVFHISEVILGKEDFTFTPRIPRFPLSDKHGNSWEDDFTPRVSLAPSVEKAISAGAKGNYVYAGNTSEYVDLAPRVDNCPGGAMKNTRFHFSLGDYLNQIQDELTDEELERIFKASRVKTNKLPEIRDVKLTDLPERIRQRFYLCVPDAKDTDEKVSLKPITLLFLGAYVGGYVKLVLPAQKYLYQKSKELSSGWTPTL